MPNYKDQACPRSIVKKSQLQAKKKGIFDAAAKIGKLEFLNDFGLAGGNVRKGLEQLAVVSDTVRVGNTTTDTDVLLDDSGGGLMEAMSLGGSVQAAVAQFDPNAVNGAVGASKSLVARAKQGNFRMEDIATAVGEFKNIALIAGKIFKPPLSGSYGSDYQKFQCRPSPFAVDLVHKAPKQNFQFVVEIELNAAYRQQFILGQQDITDQFEDRTQVLFDSRGRAIASRTAVSETNHALSTQLAFLIKTSGRPSPTYEYEDLNYYNYRTQGIRKTAFNPIQMTFVDDQLNTAAAFYAFYTSAMSPIVNMGASPNEAAGNSKNYEQAGMNFADNRSQQASSNGLPNTYPAYAATAGALRPATEGQSNNTKRIIDRITIFQFGKNANTVTAYNMFAPRILSFSPSDVTMADSGDGQELGMEIAYDYFTIQPDIEVGGTDMSSDRLADISGGAAGANFPIRHFQNDESGTQNNKDQNLLTKIGSVLGFEQ